MLKHGKVVDSNHLPVPLAFVHAGVWQATTRQHGFRLTGELFSCSTFLIFKSNRAPTAHHTTARAKRPIELLVHIDTAGPIPASLGGSRYVVIFVDSAFRLQHPSGTRVNSAATIIAVEKCIMAWEFREHSGVKTEQNTRTIHSWNAATASGSDAI